MVSATARLHVAALHRETRHAHPQHADPVLNSASMVVFATFKRHEIQGEDCVPAAALVPCRMAAGQDRSGP